MNENDFDDAMKWGTIQILKLFRRVEFVALIWGASILFLAYSIRDRNALDFIFGIFNICWTTIELKHVYKRYRRK